MGFSYSPKVVTDGLVLYLDAANPLSYANGSTKWNDLSRGRNNGTLINGPSFQDNAIVFDGVDDYVTTSLRIETNDFTDEVWVYTPSTFLAENQISAQYIQSDVGRYILSLNQIPETKVRYFLGGTKGYSNQTILPDSWYQIVIVREGSVGYIYINGEFDKTVTAGTTAVASSPVYTLGQLSQLNNGYSWAGRIAQAKIYNRALTAQEVQRNYQALKSRFGL